MYLNYALHTYRLFKAKLVYIYPEFDLYAY